MKCKKKQITLVTRKSIFYSCKFSYVELEPDETDGIFKFIKSSLNKNESWVTLCCICFVNLGKFYSVPSQQHYRTPGKAVH